jgi:hypothetical protein
MSISIERAFADLHNLSVKESHRKYLPQIMLVAVDENACIVKTEKFKEVPELEAIHAFGSDCKGTSIFIARTETVGTIESFRRVVSENAEAIRRRRQGITDDPDTYYPGRGFGKGNNLSGK